MSRKHFPILAVIMFAAMSFSLSEPAFAGSGGGGLPWESPLQQIQQSITGPVAGFIALAAVAIAGAMLIFGGELNDFARRLCYVALVGGVLLGRHPDRRSLRCNRGVDRRAPRRGRGCSHRLCACDDAASSRGGGSWLKPVPTLSDRGCIGHCRAPTC